MYQFSGRICSLFCMLFIASIVLDQRTAAESTDSNDDEDWNSFKTRFNKRYSNQTEDNYRRTIRQRNLALINSHNAAAASGSYKFRLRENSFVDWTDQEYQQLLGFKGRSSAATETFQSKFIPFMPEYDNTVNTDSLPTCVNWTASGWVGPVMNQGQCGSCWAYSATGSLQSQYYNYSGQLVQFSQQNLIDCSSAQGNDGCNGGNMQNAFWYIQTNGIESLASYPDTSDVTGVNTKACAFNASYSVTSIESWRNVYSGSESALQQAVALVGPISAAIDASSEEFQYYSDGVYNSSTCGSSISDLDHAILVVGYGVYNDQQYWLIKNSWGKDWGINGYMMMARNDNNMCGIATDATFPIISQTSSLAPAVDQSRVCTSLSDSNNFGDTQSTSKAATAVPSQSLVTFAITLLALMTII